jgi:hypothetical protein
MIINKFTSSPFKLRRSIVPRNEGGAYETGGFDPDSYDSSPQIYAASIEGMAKTVGAALGSLTKSDLNKMDMSNNERRQKRVSNIDEKIKKAEVGTNKSKRLEDKKARIENRIQKTDKRINEYESVYGKNSTSNDFLNKQRQQ